MTCMENNGSILKICIYSLFLLFTQNFQKSMEIYRAQIWNSCHKILTLTKSPPWIMKSFMTLWKLAPLYPIGTPSLRYSPVQNWRKFSLVLGQTSEYNSIIIRPISWKKIDISHTQNKKRTDASSDEVVIFRH